MNYPSSKLQQVSLMSRPLEWNKLTTSEYVVISREKNGVVNHFFGQVESLEKLRNCHMLNFKVWEAWSDGTNGYEHTAEQLNLLASGIHGISVPCKVSWKKPKGVEIRTWDPFNQTGYVPSHPLSKSYSYRTVASSRMPSELTYERVGNPTGSELDDRLKARAAKRQVYVAARGLLQAFRDELTEALTLLGLTYESTPNEVKLVQRRVMKDWHPDREALYCRNTGASPDHFKAESSKWMAALARVKNALITKTTDVETQ